MREAILNVTQTEYELLTRFGVVDKLTEGDTFTVKFQYPSEYTISELAQSMEDAIVFEESDQGDWLRAQDYRKCKLDLMSKVRKAILTISREV